MAALSPSMLVDDRWREYITQDLLLELSVNGSVAPARVLVHRRPSQSCRSGLTIALTSKSLRWRPFGLAVVGSSRANLRRKQVVWNKMPVIFEYYLWYPIGHVLGMAYDALIMLRVSTVSLANILVRLLLIQL